MPKDSTTCAELAKRWKVNDNTIRRWADTCMIAFGLKFAKSGPYTAEQVQMIDICAMHIGPEAGLYYTKTRQERRLKAMEFIQLIQDQRKAGHYAELLATESDELDQDELDAAEAEAIATLKQEFEAVNDETDQMIRVLDSIEDEAIDRVANHISNRGTRRVLKLAARLREMQSDREVIEAEIDVAALPSGK